MQRKIINQLSNKITTQSSDISKLKKIELIATTKSYFKKQNEIVLAEYQYLGTMSFNESYTFMNLEEKDLIYFTPYAYLETSQGYKDIEKYPFTWSSEYSWEKQENNIILNIKVSGYILAYTNDMWRSDIAPIYLTAKILNYNPKLFSLIIKDKS
jgi:hypothetical protein